MNLPIVYQPGVASAGNGTMRFMLVTIDVLSKTKKPGLADMDEYGAFCQAADARTSPSLTGARS